MQRYIALSRLTFPLLWLIPAMHEAEAQCPNVVFLERSRFPAFSDDAPFLLAGDVDNDGKVDLIFRTASDEVRVAKGDGLGNFTVSTVAISVPGAKAARVADFNRDGNLDLVIGGQNSIRWYSGDGSGAFQLRILSNLAAPGALAPPPNISGIEVADFDGDGRMDTAFTETDSDAIQTRNPIDSNFQFRTEILTSVRFALPQNGRPVIMGAGDFDDDGSVDLIALNRFENSISIVAPAFASGVARQFGDSIAFTAPRRAVAARFDDDRFVDAAVIGTAPEIQFFRGQARGMAALSPAATVALPAPASALATGDFNGDGRVDVLVGYDNGSIDWLRNDGNYSWTRFNLTGLVGPVRALVVADFDRNGTADFALLQRNPERVVVYLNQCPAPGPDIFIANMEIIQSVQDLANSVPLIEGKRTFVRVHVGGGIPVGGLTAQLQGIDAAGAALSPATLVPSNPNVTIDLPPNPDRSKLNDSFCFEIPLEWTRSGPITLRATVDTTNQLNDRDRANNVRTLSATFVKTCKLRAHIFELDAPLISLGKTGDPTVEAEWDRQYAEMIRLLQANMPMTELEVSRERVMTDRDLGTLNTSPALGLFMLNLADESTRPRGTLFFGNGDIFGGAADGDPFRKPNIAAWGNFTEIVHEFGHLLTLGHAPGCNPPDPDPAFPYEDGIIGGPLTDPTRFLGIDCISPTDFGGPVRIIRSETHDLMTYCHDKPVFSDYSLAKMSGYFATEPYFARHVPSRLDTRISSFQSEAPLLLAAAVIPRLPRRPEPQPVWSVSGAMVVKGEDRDVQVSVSPREMIAAGFPSEGNLRFKLIDSNGAELAHVTAKTARISDAPGTYSFYAVLPRLPGAAAIVLSEVDGRLLGTYPISAHPPHIGAVRVRRGRAPDACQEVVNLRWTAADKDGDRLRFAVRYSPDRGKSWTLLASELSASTLTVPQVLLAGTRGQKNGVFRVDAHDGAHVESAYSRYLRFPNNPPRIFLLSAPSANHGTRRVGQQFTAQVMAQDLEDGMLSGQAIVWRSGGAVLGSGDTLQRTDLPTGMHTIEVEARDSDGGLARESIQIVISP